MRGENCIQNFPASIADAGEYVTIAIEKAVWKKNEHGPRTLFANPSGVRGVYKVCGGCVRV